MTPHEGLDVALQAESAPRRRLSSSSAKCLTSGSISLTQAITGPKDSPNNPQAIASVEEISQHAPVVGMDYSGRQFTKSWIYFPEQI